MMLGTYIALPFLAMAVGALFGMWLNERNGLLWGAAIGFGVGCAIIVLVWALFAALKRWADE